MLRRPKRLKIKFVATKEEEECLHMRFITFHFIGCKHVFTLNYV